MNKKLSIDVEPITLIILISSLLSLFVGNFYLDIMYEVDNYMTEDLRNEIIIPHL